MPFLKSVFHINCRLSFYVFVNLFADWYKGGDFLGESIAWNCVKFDFKWTNYSKNLLVNYTKFKMKLYEKCNLFNKNKSQSNNTNYNNNKIIVCKIVIKIPCKMIVIPEIMPFIFSPWPFYDIRNSTDRYSVLMPPVFRPRLAIHCSWRWLLETSSRLKGIGDRLVSLIFFSLQNISSFFGKFWLTSMLISNID